MLYRAAHIVLADSWEEYIAEQKTLGEGVLIIACYNGKMKFTHGETTFTMEKDDLTLFLPSFCGQDYEQTSDFQCKVLYASKLGFDAIAHECLLGEPQWFEKMTYLSQHPIIRLNQFRKGLLSKYRELLLIYMEGLQSGYHTQIISSLTRAIMLEIMSYMDQIEEQIKIPVQDMTQGDVLFTHFIDLLKNSILEHREVQWYAEQLCVTPKYLTIVCRKRTGRTASQWIQQLAMDKIMQTLQQTDLSIKEVAYATGFDDVSFFCQFVRKHTGMTPVALRAKR